MSNEDPIAALIRMAGPRPKIDDDIEARVRTAVAAEWRREVRRRRTVRVTWSALAMAAALGIIFVQTTLMNRTTPATPVAVAQVSLASVDVLRGAADLPRRIVAGSRVTTGADGVVAFDWKNHGSLRLAPRTIVRFVTSDTISVELGTVYFASAALQRTPIEVRTPRGSIVDVGTQFEVQVADDRNVRVRVREGSINLGSTHAGAGTQLTANAESIGRGAIAPDDPSWSWVLDAAPAMKLDGNLRALLDAVAREKGLELVFADAQLAESAKSSMLHGGLLLTPDEALHTAVAASGLDYRIARGQLIINRK